MAKKSAKKYEPTADTSALVLRLTLEGWTQHRIAAMLRIDVATLGRHFRHELAGLTKTGRPPHRPTEKDRTMVRALYIAGWTQPQIAEVIDVDEKTLRLHYREELDRGKALIDANVTMSIVHMAMGGKGTKESPFDPQKAVPSMAAFYAKTRMGWKPPPADVNLGGAVGHYDLSKLSDDELERVTELLERIAVGSAGDATGGEGSEEEGETTF